MPFIGAPPLPWCGIGLWKRQSVVFLWSCRLRLGTLQTNASGLAPRIIIYLFFQECEIRSVAIELPLNASTSRSLNGAGQSVCDSAQRTGKVAIDLHW
jgi:hypothetical protein